MVNSELEENNNSNQEIIPVSPKSLTESKDVLNQEALEIISQIVAENDEAKTKDLTFLFNQNQNKKAMIRVNKMGELLDMIADQTMSRFANRPDEISNQELLQGLKVIQEIVDKGQKQLNTPVDTPLIQVNQQNNEINLGEATTSLNRESREKVKNAVMSILAGMTSPTTLPSEENSEVIIEENFEEEEDTTE